MASESNTNNSQKKNRNNVGRPPEAGKIQSPIDTETRDYWLSRAETLGIDETLTEIHNEIGRLEQEVFAGGFSQERFDRVQSLRLLSREMWNLQIRKQTAKTYGETEASKTFGNLGKLNRS